MGLPSEAGWADMISGVFASENKWRRLMFPGLFSDCFLVSNPVEPDIFS